jgi:hypothetical protein
MSRTHLQRGSAGHRSGTVRPVLAPLYAPNTRSELYSNPVSDSFMVKLAECTSVLKNSLGTRFRPGSATKHTGFGAFRARSLVDISSTPTFSTGSHLPRTQVNNEPRSSMWVFSCFAGAGSSSFTTVTSRLPSPEARSDCAASLVRLARAPSQCRAASRGARLSPRSSDRRSGRA